MITKKDIDEFVALCNQNLSKLTIFNSSQNMNSFTD